METGINTPWQCVIYLFTNYDDVITVTRRMSRQFNFSLGLIHVKINHIEFEDKFLIKPTRMQKIFCWKTAKGMF